jgi:hypothetical protein
VSEEDIGNVKVLGTFLSSMGIVKDIKELT